VEHTVNANIAHCIVKAQHAGYTRITNICSGKITEVDWGVFDWIATFGLVGLGVAGVALLGAFVFAMVKMTLDA
jgi:hypothetical protein